MINSFSDRRAFLAQFLIGLPMLSIFSGCEYANNEVDKKLDILTSWLRYAQVAINLGRQNLQSSPELQGLSIEQLIAEIAGNTQKKEKGSPLLIQDLRNHLEQKIRNDFTDENIVLIDGWLLSKTEASICTLLYLKQQ